MFEGNSTTETNGGAFAAPACAGCSTCGILSAVNLFFTWLLDMLMTRWSPVYYRSQSEFESLVEASGFEVVTLFLDEILWYPHILYFCTKGVRRQA